MHLRLTLVSSVLLTGTLFFMSCGGDDAGDADSSGQAGDNGESGSTSQAGETGQGTGGDDGAAGSTAAGTNGDGEGGSTAAGEAGSTSNAGTAQGGTSAGGDTGCDPVTSQSGEDCPELTECALDACGDAYADCMGENYMSGDFSGGECESYMECLADCSTGDACDTSCAEDCTPDSACLNCLLDIAPCIQENCADEQAACGGAAGAGAGGAPGLPGIDGTCEDLLACCESLDEDEQAECMTNYNMVSSAGDVACSVLLDTYEAAGSC